MLVVLALRTAIESKGASQNIRQLAVRARRNPTFKNYSKKRYFLTILLSSKLKFSQL